VQTISTIFSWQALGWDENVKSGPILSGTVPCIVVTEGSKDAAVFGYFPGCSAACRPARRPEKTQSAIDEPLAK